MKLHKNTQLFRQAITATAQFLNIPEIFVEKDYWVTFALKLIFSAPVGHETVFKGGTALSKCDKLIERFSEDIDLVVKHNEGDTSNLLKRKIKNIGKAVNLELPEETIDGLTIKMGMNRKTAHSYPKLFKGTFGQARDVIIIEATWLGYFEPYTTSSVSSFIYDMMIERDQLSIAEEYDLLPFEVTILRTTRTLCEKIMSLVRFSYSENAIDDLSKKIRHTYDLHQLLQEPELQAFFRSDEFEILLKAVAQDDVKSFKNNKQWLRNHPKDSLIFADTENVWKQLKAVYRGNFKDLVYGELPAEDKILQTLILIQKRISIINWDISIPPE